MAGENGLYRSRKGIFMGVCKGIAGYFNFSGFWVRMVVLLLFLFTGFWPVGVIYIIAGLLMQVEPVSPLRTETDRAFYDNYTQSRSSAIQRIKRKFDNIERRIQRMEHTVTSREFDWK
jgi:phage shock protein C